MAFPVVNKFYACYIGRSEVRVTRKSNNGGKSYGVGPSVTIATANHPIEPSLRENAMQYNKTVHIGENVWIGAGTIIVPGVTIGKNSVIGAGSVVVKDIPDNVVAVGNPCRVLRKIGEHDHEFFYKNEKIDWENL